MSQLNIVIINTSEALVSTFQRTKDNNLTAVRTSQAAAAVNIILIIILYCIHAFMRAAPGMQGRKM